MKRPTVPPAVSSFRSGFSQERAPSPRETRARTLRIAAASLILLSFCVACTDTSAVAKFAASAKKACTGFSDIANDFAGSATRRARYVNADEKPKVLAQAEHYKELEPQIETAQKILVDYVAALAALSTDSTTAREKSIQATQSDLTQLGMTTNQAAAGVALAGKLADILVSGYRSRKLEQAIREANAPLQEYLQGLEQIVGVDYITQLNIERTSVRGYYGQAIFQYGKNEPLAAILVNTQMNADLSKLDDKEKAALAYKKILVDIGEAHQKLYDNATHTDKKHLALLLEPYAEDIGEQSTKLAKAF
ncbi:MAG: hypothetical protein WA419_22615 [Silvibacterium sp.]